MSFPTYPPPPAPPPPPRPRGSRRIALWVGVVGVCAGLIAGARIAVKPGGTGGPAPAPTATATWWAGVKTVTPSVSVPDDGSRIDLDAAGAQAAPLCSVTFAAGARLPAVTGSTITCTDPDGLTVFVPLIRCANGGHIGTVLASFGGPSGWFQAPGVVHAVRRGEPVADPAYGKAFATCNR